jgi:hypothetical protein
MIPLRDPRWFVEASFMPGLCRESARVNGLGSPVEFRSLLGVGYRFGNGAQISLAAEHKSNAGISTTNPGVNLLSLRLRRGF